VKDEYAILVIGGPFLSMACHRAKPLEGSKATSNPFQVIFSLGEEEEKEVLKLLNNKHANAANVLCCISCYMKVRQMVRNIVQARPPQATPSQATPPQSTPPQATPLQATPPQATLPQGTTLQTTPPQATGHISTSALDDIKPIIGRPRVSYNLASARTKSEIKKKARQICNTNKTNLMQQLDEVYQGCSEDIYPLQKCPL